MSQEPRCISKKTGQEGSYILKAWCGESILYHGWYFQDTHHAALSVGGSVAMCQGCVKAIIEEFQKEME